MLNLTPITPDYSLFYVLGGVLGALFLLFAYLMLHLVFKLPLNLKSKDKKERATLLTALIFGLLAALLPILLLSLGIQLKNASLPRQEISEVKITEIDQGLQLVDFSTPEPAQVYFKYRDLDEQIFRPVLPTYVLEPLKDHSIIVDVKESGGEAILVVNGQEYLLEGNTLAIPYQQ